MKNLFEKEGKETAICQLKIDLISRFYLFSKEQLLQYHQILNFDRYHLMNNHLIKWDNELIEAFKDKIDWSALWKIKNIVLDFNFFKTYENYIEFDSIHLSKSINWSDNLVREYGDRLDWSKWLITKEPLAKIKNLRRFQDILDWNYVSQRISLVRDENVLDEFHDKWNWQKLSSNPHLPISVRFIQKHLDKLDFDDLSQNPKSIDLIYRYPNSKRWNWERVILNPAINYNKESFDFIFHHFKRHYESKYSPNSILKRFALHNFLVRVFSRLINGKSYFLNEEFIKVLPWENICKFCSDKLPLDFIEKYKE